MSELPNSAVVSPGTLLRQARQAQGLHIEALAASLKVSVSKLQALEADNFEVFPDPNFVRAFAGSVCRTLKIDPTPVLAAMPAGAQPRLVSHSEGLNTRLRDERSRSLFTLLGGKWVTLAVVGLLLGALVVFFLPPKLDLKPQKEAALPAQAVVPKEHKEQKAETVQVVQPPPRSSASLPPPVAPVVTPQTPLASAPMPSSASTSAPVVLSPAPSENKPVAVESPTVAAASASGVDAPAQGLLVLSAKAPSWIHVRDSKGTTVLQRTLGAGESVTVSHEPPLSVRVGRADMTDVYIRGKRFELTAITRENTARFEVK